MSKRLSILAIDQATKTGWALLTFSGNIISGVQDFKRRRGESSGMIFLRFEKWLDEITAGVNVIYYEQAHHRGGAATAIGAGLVAIILKYAAENDIETCSVHSGSLKKFAIGSGKASKAEMFEAAKKYKADVQDDNEADALHMLHYAIQEIG